LSISGTVATSPPKKRVKLNYEDLSPDSLDMSEEYGGQALSYTKWYVDRTLYVLKCTIPPYEKYGPYTMREIYNLPRMPTTEIHRIMDIIDNDYTHLDELEPDKYWTLQDEDIFPKPTVDLPNSVIESAKFVHMTYQSEMKDCVGVIILPANIRHNGWKHDRVHVVHRDSFTITMIEVDPGAWFLLQTCRCRFYEVSDETTWYLLQKDHLPKFCYEGTKKTEPFRGKPLQG
jgi:hypothetical protein